MWDNKGQIRQITSNRQRHQKKEAGKLNEPSQAGGLLGEALLKMAAKGAYNAARLGASKAVKSNFAKKKIKNVANKYLDQALDTFTSDLSKKLDPFSGSGIKKTNKKQTVKKPTNKKQKNTTPKAYCGAKKVPKGRYLGDWNECKNQVRYYGLTELDQDVLDKWEKERKEKEKTKRAQNKTNKKLEELRKSGIITQKTFEEIKKSNSETEKFNKKLEELRKSGLITQKTFEAAKSGKGILPFNLLDVDRLIRINKKRGRGLDIHKAILKVAPKKGFVMPGHRYTGPGNPLEQQLRYDPNTGQILEIYQQPTGKTDAVSMQHDVDYSVCGNKPKGDQVKCKNEADRKMVKALDAIPWKERQWGHAIARNAIAAKSKLGMGVKKSKNVKSR